MLDEPEASAIAAAGLDHGVIVNDCQPDVVRLAPPLVLGAAEVADAEQRLGSRVERRQAAADRWAVGINQPATKAAFGDLARRGTARERR